MPPLADGVLLPKLQKPILFSLHLNENTHTTIFEYLLNQYHHDYISIYHFIPNQWQFYYLLRIFSEYFTWNNILWMTFHLLENVLIDLFTENIQPNPFTFTNKCNEFVLATWHLQTVYYCYYYSNADETSNGYEMLFSSIFSTPFIFHGVCSNFEFSVGWIIHRSIYSIEKS